MSVASPSTTPAASARATVVSPTALCSQKQPVVVAIDNDECVGSWGDLSLLYTLYTHVLRQPDPPIDVFTNLLTATGCARPHLREFYDSLLERKAKGDIHAIVMCTSARDTLGWVSFLRRVLEAWYGKPIYDHLVEGNMLLEWHSKHGSPCTDASGCIFKDMNQVRQIAGVSKDTPVVAIDDHPEKIVNGHGIGVEPYTVAVNLVAVCRQFVEGWSDALEAHYLSSLQESWMSFHRDASRFTVAWADKQLQIASSSVADAIHRLTAAAGMTLLSVAMTVPPVSPRSRAAAKTCGSALSALTEVDEEDEAEADDKATPSSPLPSSGPSGAFLGCSATAGAARDADNRSSMKESKSDA